LNTTRPKITACIIAKDEEAQLPRCLSSIVNLCDEIVVVDTGSSDKTVEIADSYGAKVYHHKWMNDFSLHRNQAFNYANGVWLLVIDCDEELLIKPEDVAIFRQRLDKIADGVTQLVLTVVETNNGNEASWLGSRIFRATAKPRYKHCVHNKLVCEGLAALTDVYLKHYGYHLPPDKMKAKRKRTKELLHKRLKEDPEDYNAYYYLCQMAQGDKEWEKSIEYGKKCIEFLPITKSEDLQYFATLYFWLSNAYMNADKAGWALAYIEHGLNFFPDDLDLNFMMVLFGYRTNDRALMLRHAKRYFKTLRRIKTKKSFKSGGFVNLVEKQDFTPRTIYTIGDRHKAQVRKWLKEAKGFAA
jgi:glycosyltransferase involved in cell wall biosynthesis